MWENKLPFGHYLKQLVSDTCEVHFIVKYMLYLCGNFQRLMNRQNAIFKICHMTVTESKVAMSHYVTPAVSTASSAQITNQFQWPVQQIYSMILLFQNILSTLYLRLN